MSIEIVKRWGVFFILLLVQGLVCNHIHLFHCATPLLYIMFVLHFRRNTPRWQVLLWSFALGLDDGDSSFAALSAGVVLTSRQR